MSDDTYSIKKSYRKSANQSETDLILKIYQKQVSAHNKGKGPKPDLDALINKSRVKDFGFDESRFLKSPEDRTWNHFKIGRSIVFPKGLKLEFTEEVRALPGFYLIQFPNGIKFGISKNIKQRLIEYQKPWCQAINNHLFYYVGFSVARDIETTLIRDFYTYCTEGTREFVVNVTVNELISRIKNLIKPIR